MKIKFAGITAMLSTRVTICRGICQIAVLVEGHNVEVDAWEYLKRWVLTVGRLCLWGSLWKQGTSVRSKAWRREEGGESNVQAKRSGQTRTCPVYYCHLWMHIFRISHAPEKGNTLSEKSCLTIFMWKVVCGKWRKNWKYQ